MFYNIHYFKAILVKKYIMHFMDVPVTDLNFGSQGFLQPIILNVKQKGKWR